MSTVPYFKFVACEANIGVCCEKRFLPLEGSNKVENVQTAEKRPNLMVLG